MKKNMKLLKRTLAALLAVLLLTACLGAAAEAQPRRMETAADADEWIAVFLGEHPETLDGAWLMTPQMEAAIAQLGGLKGMAASLAALGPAETVLPAYEGTLSGYKTFNVPCAFAAMKLDLVLVTLDGAIAGLNTGVYTGDRQPAAENEAFRTVALALPVPALDGELPGTLLLPNGEGPFPAVVLVHGSGANDRDEAVGALKPFRDLAEGLAARGIAVYRFDKRTYVFGTRMVTDHGITLEDESIDDAVAAVQLLARQEGIDPERIWVLGHSLGGNAVPAIHRALREQPVQACGYVMMAASPRPLEVLMREQYDFLYSLLPEVTPQQQAEKDALFAELDRLRDLDTLTDDDAVAGVYAPYWKWLAAYDALEAAKDIDLPCLLLQGEEDYQVTMEDFALWQAALGGKANWRLVSCPGLTHTFVPGLKAEGSAVYAREARVDGQVIESIADFILRGGAEP